MESWKIHFIARGKKKKNLSKQNELSRFFYVPLFIFLFTTVKFTINKPSDAPIVANKRRAVPSGVWHHWFRLQQLWAQLSEDQVQQCSKNEDAHDEMMWDEQDKFPATLCHSTTKWRARLLRDPKDHFCKFHPFLSFISPSLIISRSWICKYY